MQHLLYPHSARNGCVEHFSFGDLRMCESHTLEPVTVAAEAPRQLHRILGIRDLVLMIVGTVIGSGIFLVPGPVLRSVGNSVPLALLVWLGGGMLSLLGALTYGELSAMRPRAGGIYIYIRDCYGKFPAFLFGWTLFFVISSGSIATLAVAFSNYVGEFFSLSTLAAKLIAVLLIAIIAAVNVCGTRQSADLLNITTAVKVTAILAASALLLLRGTSPIFVAANSAGRATPGMSGVGFAMISVLWAYEGWQYATYTAGETIDPQRTFPIAFFAGTGFLIAIYLVANLGYIAALGAQGVADSPRVATSALGTILSSGAGKVVALAILISIFSAANSIMLNSPRVYYAMAKDGFFFYALCRIHPKFGTPAVAILVAAVWSAILAASGTFEQLLTYVVFIGWLFYALAAGCVFIYRAKFPKAPRTYRVPAYPLTPIAFIVAAGALVVNTVVSQPVRAGIGLAIVFLGAPAYLFWRRNAPPLEGEA